MNPTLADVDGDGRGELLGGAQHGLEVWRAVQRDSGPEFALAVDFPVTDIGRAPLVLDFDRDGALDVIVSRSLRHAPAISWCCCRGGLPSRARFSIFFRATDEIPGLRGSMS